MSLQNKKRSVKNLSELLNNEHRSDVIFLVGKCGQKIFGHRIILEMASDVFDAMFNHDFLESKQNTVEIPDIEPEVFLELLRFIYDQKANVTKENLVPLYAAADRYLMDDLKAFCFLNIDKTNVLWVRKVNSMRFNLDEIEQKCTKFISSQLLSVMQHADLESLDEKDIKLLFKDNKHLCSRNDIICFLGRWKKEELSYNSLRSSVRVVRPLLER